MRLTTRTTLTMLLVAGVPLGLAGYSSIQLSESALQERAHELHVNVARGIATKIDDALQARIHAVQNAAATVAFHTLSDPAVRGALRLVYRQVDGASAVALFDRKTEQVGVTEFLTKRRLDDAIIADRPALTNADINLFGRHLPLSAAREVGAAVSAPYVASDGGPRLTVAVVAADAHLLAVELSLEDLQQVVETRRIGSRGRAFVVDSKGKIILDPDRKAVAKRVDRSKWSSVKAVLAGRFDASELHDPMLGKVLGSAAPVADFGWAVIVAEPSKDALAAATALTQRNLIWLLVSVIAASVLGVFSARRVVGPVRRLHRGATALQAGDLDHRIEGTERTDELGGLARAFNSMAEEIQRWNRELEDRVEQKTRELKEAQELLIRSQKLAAVGELGAGVAHEINNPLTGLLGLVQLARAKEPAGSKHANRLELVEQEALRIREIVANLERLTGTQESANLKPMAVQPILDGALSLMQGKLEKQNVKVVRHYDQDVPEVSAIENELSEAFLHLLNNASAAMPSGGTLTLGINSIDGRLVAIRVGDTGDGIPEDLHERIFEPFFSTKRDQQAKGLGLTQVNRIVDAHHGRVRLESEVGLGSTFSVLLPAAQVRSLE